MEWTAKWQRLKSICSAKIACGYSRALETKFLIEPEIRLEYAGIPTIENTRIRFNERGYICMPAWPTWIAVQGNKQVSVGRRLERPIDYTHLSIIEWKIIYKIAIPTSPPPSASYFVSKHRVSRTR